MNLTRKTDSPEDSPPGLPMTISASHIDGLVLALTPNHHSYNFRSATLFGHATLVTSPEEKLYAMELITNRIVPSRWSNSRIPPTPAEMQSTSILRVKIQAGSAKLRSGGPHDDRHDLEDGELLERVWTGVVPAYTVLGEPVASEYNRVKEVPGYLRDFVRETNVEEREFALEALKEDGGGKQFGL